MACVLWAVIFPVVVFLDFEVTVVFVAYWFMGCSVLLFCWLRWWFVGLLGWVFLVVGYFVRLDVSSWM